MLREHASEIIVGVALGLLTDLLTDLASRKMRTRRANLFA